MKNKIIFIGGIHGVGKGTVCEKISTKFSIPHFSSSELLNWEEISSKENKKVNDFDQTQSRLLAGIELKLNKNELTILDGHFCLLNKNGIPEKIHEDTFLSIDPIAIVIVTHDVKKILERLKNRDKSKYDIKILSDMQKLEVDQAKQISKKLKVPLMEVNSENFKELEIFIKHGK